MVACSTPFYLPINITLIGSCNILAVGLHMQQQHVPKIQKLEAR